MNYSELSLSPSDFSVTSLEVGRWMGYPDGEMPGIIAQQTDEAIGELLTRADTRGGYGISDRISIKPAAIEIEHIEFDTQRIISGSLQGATSAAIFVCTIGEAVSDAISDLIKDDPVKGYIADIAASLLAEKVAEKIHQEIRRFASDSLSLSISNRYSPGYCGWPVANQHRLFSLLPDNFCGITLNEAALMHPIKSISGVVGIGKGISVLPYSCNRCEVKDCIMSFSQ